MSNILHRQERPSGAAHVAANVRLRRRARALSQAALAKLSGVSRRMLIAIETDEANVSLSTLDRLANALGCSLSELVRPPSAPDNRRIDTVVWSRAGSPSKGVLLGTSPATREAEMWIWSLAEGERYMSEEGSENWHEMLFVIEGALAVETQERRHGIEAGDFLIFSSAQPYVFANGGKGVVRFIRNVIL